MPGREHAFRAFFTVAEELEVKACVVVDANLRSLTSDWMEVLLRPVIEKGVDYVAPLFRRARYEGSLTNCIIYPLSRALYGKRMRYQSGGGYGFSGKLASLYLTKNVWEGEAARYGIDSWLTTVAVAEGCEVSQGFLGTKIHDATLTGIELSVLLAQAVGALFHLMEAYQDVWEGRKGSSPVPQFGPPYEQGPEGGAVNVERMVRGFQQGLRDLLPIWEIILAPETLAGILSLGLVEAEEFRFPAALWVQTIYDFALAYHEKALHREHLLKSLTPLYLGRTASLVLETREGTSGGCRTGHRNTMRDVREHETLFDSAMEVPMSILWQEAMLEAFRETTLRIAHLLPKLLALLTFLALGLAAGWLVKFLFLRILRAFRFDALCERFGLGSSLAKAGTKQSASHLIGRLSFWLVFLLFAFMGIDALDLTATANMMSVIIGFFPQMLAAVLLLFLRVAPGQFHRRGGPHRHGERPDSRSPNHCQLHSMGCSHLHGGDGADPTRNRQRDRRGRLLDHVRRYHVGTGHRSRLRRPEHCKGRSGTTIASEESGTGRNVAHLGSL